MYHTHTSYSLLSLTNPLIKTYRIMKKIQINVPSGIKYLSDWDELWDLLPNDRPFILNKRICGCGATEMYIRSDKKVILASPRKHLLYNKYSQHFSDNLYLYRFQGDKRSILKVRQVVKKRFWLLMMILLNISNMERTRYLPPMIRLGRLWKYWLTWERI